MGTFDLSIEFDHPNREYQIGDTITGIVTVRVDKKTKCDGLKLTCFWSTSNDCDNLKISPLIDTVFEGEWQSGTYKYPFKFTPLEGPLTFHGEVLQVRWYIRADADIPWKLDPSVTEEFYLRKSVDYQKNANFTKQLAYRAASRSNDGPPIFNIIVVGLPAIVFTLNALVFISINFIVGLATLLFGLSIIIFFQRHAVFAILADLQFSHKKLVVSAQPIIPGSAVEYTLSLKPAANLSVEHITLSIDCFERILYTSGSGKHQRTFTKRHTLYNNCKVLEKSVKLKKHQELNLKGTVDIPTEIAPSLGIPDNEIIWRLTAEIKTKYLPIAAVERRLHILP